MPCPELLSVAMFICERVLQEADGVTSAIRIVDLFNLPEIPPDAPEGALPLIQAYSCAMLKFAPTFSGKHYIQSKMINTKGELVSLGEPLEYSPQMRAGAEGAPLGLNFTIQMNVAVKNLGTCYLCVYFDGEEIGRTPFTLQRQPPLQAAPGMKK